MAPATTIIPDFELYAYAERAAGQVVVVTGGAVGLGKAGALEFAARGAKIAIGDINVKDGEQTVDEIRKAGGSAIFRRCDVTKWDNLVALFKAASDEFGSVDIVIANAGVNELGNFMETKTDDKGVPKPPTLKTVEINLLSVLNTSHLAIDYFTRSKKADSLKTLVIIGSIASITALPGCPMYSCSKHALVGFMRGLHVQMAANRMRVAMVAPWFVDTALLTDVNRVITGGLPKTPASRVAGAMILAATDKDPETNGSTYTLPDEREVVRVPHTEINEGIYKWLNKRSERVLNFGGHVKIYSGILNAILGLKGVRLVGLLTFGFVGVRMGITKGWFKPCLHF